MNHWIDGAPTQARWLNELHRPNTQAAHAGHLFAAFMWYFSRPLAGIFFFHEMLDQINP